MHFCFHVADYSFDWTPVFKGAQLADGSRIQVEQTEWKSISAVSCSEKGAVLNVEPSSNPFPFTNQGEQRIVQPDFALIRNFPNGLHGISYKNVLMALMFANVPSVNSLQSIFMCMHRPLVYAELLKIRNRLGFRESGTVTVTVTGSNHDTTSDTAGRRLESDSESDDDNVQNTASDVSPSDSTDSSSTNDMSSDPCVIPAAPSIVGAITVAASTDCKQCHTVSSSSGGLDSASSVSETKTHRGALWKFPIIDMMYHPNNSTAILKGRNIPTPSFPCVIKVSTTHSGFGKAKANNQDDFDDTRSVRRTPHGDCDCCDNLLLFPLYLCNNISNSLPLCLSLCLSLPLSLSLSPFEQILMMKPDQYYTTEPFIHDADFEYRIQKIGDHYRGFKRISDSSWKNNWGNLRFEDFPLTDEHMLWIHETAALFGGLDIVSIDVLRTKSGDDIILEINDTAPGLMYEHEKEDSIHIRDLVVNRMSHHLV
jgi:Synapsin, ATP binding domain/Synapsin, N-terminal domain